MNYIEKVEIGEHVLYHGDSFKLLLEMDEKVDHVITDPPYSDKTHKGARTNKRQKTEDSKYRQQEKVLINFDCISDAEFENMCMNLLYMTKRWIIMTCDYRHTPLVFDWEQFIRLGVWAKIAPMPQITGDRPGSGHENVLILHNKGKKRWNSGGKPALWIYPVMKQSSLMPTQKPIKLIEHFITDFTDEGEIVFDPFMGSGTTGEACINKGRKFIGIEKDKERFDIAVKRLQNVYNHKEEINARDLTKLF